MSDNPIKATEGVKIRIKDQGEVVERAGVRVGLVFVLHRDPRVVGERPDSRPVLDPAVGQFARVDGCAQGQRVGAAAVCFRARAGR